MSSLRLNPRSTLAIAAIALFTFSANFSFADIVKTNSLGNIPDNNVGGVSSSVTIAENETINEVSVSLNGIEHSWVGDLVVTLQGPGGQMISIMDRTGTGTFNDSSNLAATGLNQAVQTYRFIDTGGSWWNEASSGDTFYDMSAGDYQASDSSGAGVNMNSILGGTSTAGTWTLTVTDSASGDTGSIVGWTLTFASKAVSVPEPGTVCVFAGLGILFLRRRR